jgi:hypothetical protein
LEKGKEEDIHPGFALIWRSNSTLSPDLAPVENKDLQMRIHRNPKGEANGDPEDLTGATEEDFVEDLLSEDPFVEIREDPGEEVVSLPSEAVIPGEDQEGVEHGEETTEEVMVTRSEIKVIEILIIILGGQVRMTEVSMTNVRMAATPPDSLSL